MQRTNRTAVCGAAVVLVAFTGCGIAQATADTLPPLRSVAEYPAPPVMVGPDREVEWADYSADVRTAIDALATARNCIGLERQLTLATAGSSLVLNRTGHTNAKLIGYIRGKVDGAGCAMR